MKASKKIAKRARGKSSQLENKFCAAEKRARGTKRPSKAVNNKIWHNWLTEENAFFDGPGQQATQN